MDSPPGGPRRCQTPATTAPAPRNAPSNRTSATSAQPWNCSLRPELKSASPQQSPDPTRVTYRVEVPRTAARQLTKHLPEAVATARVKFLHGPLADNPHRMGTPLRNPFEGYWRARRGEYRVRYTIDESTHTVRILDISHRWDTNH